MYRNCLSLKIIQVGIIEKIEEKNHFFCLAMNILCSKYYSNVF